MIVGQVLIFGHESLLAIGWIGAAVIALAVLFLLVPGRGAAQGPPPGAESRSD